MNRYDPHLKLYNYINENAVTGMKVTASRSTNTRTSMWCRGCCWLSIGGYQLAQYEFYVPVDDTHHEYWEVLVGHCNNEDVARRRVQVHQLLSSRSACSNSTTATCSRARRCRILRAYGRLEQGTVVQARRGGVGWRKLAARFNRGIQGPPPRFANHGLIGGQA